MSEREEIMKEMNDRLTAANSYIQRIYALQEECGDTFSSDALREAVNAQTAWQVEMERYRQLNEELEHLDSGE